MKAEAKGLTSKSAYGFRLGALLLVLAVLSAWPLPVRGAERLVELVLADNEHQARVAGRTMAAGYFIDQLLIPDTSYIGLVAWPELSPDMRAALETAQPGEVHLLTGSTGKLLVARVVDYGPPAHLGRCLAVLPRRGTHRHRASRDP